MKIFISILFTLSLTMCLLVSCNDGETSMVNDSFDRRKMLEDWADLIIIPALNDYSDKLNLLVTAKDNFRDNQDAPNLNTLKNSYLAAYKSWQRVEMFNIGKAEQLGLLNYTNLYPTDVETIASNIFGQNYNLELPSNFTAQGFPALDYILFGIADSEAEVLSLLKSSEYSLYLNDLVDRLTDLTSEVVADWNGSYRETFISNDGASSTASVDKLVNDFLFYYERYLRAGKIGLPAGVFTGDPMPHLVEAPFSRIYSKDLFLESLNAVQNFFEGRGHDGTTQGQSLKSYLSHLENEGLITNIGDEISNLLDSARDKASFLSDDFYEQVGSDNSKMLETYDELQKAVVLMKVDMMSAFNVQVDYVDADGD